MSQIHTIEVSSKPFESSTISALELGLREIGILDAKAIQTKFYTINQDLSDDQLSSMAGLVHHGVTQNAIINQPLQTDFPWDFSIKVDALPGVTDNPSRVLKKDAGLIGMVDPDLYSAINIYVKGKYDPDMADQLKRLTSNPQIHDISIITKAEFDKNNGHEKKIHPVALPDLPPMFYCDVGVMDNPELILTGSDGTLNIDKKLNSEGERGGRLALALDYMLEIQKYSNSELNTKSGRKKGLLTDTELELIAQMWSEHCRHSSYNSSIPQSEKGIFDEFIRKPTEKVLKEFPHLGLSIYKDNAGVFKFNEKWLLAIKNETHNSPSKLDPYGGAITGIVGVNRDPAGTGLGAELIHNFCYYFFGHTKDKTHYYKSVNREGSRLFGVELQLNPAQIQEGVVLGVEHGGNQMGIPIDLGMAVYNDRYNGKPIVGVGSIGRMPHEIHGLLSYKKQIDVGNRLYIVGGRAGKDGIHGATFSSEVLSSKSPATAVQIGDAYTQKKMFDALLEARDKGYINFITDLGAGGVCCAAHEMAEETGGLEANLDNLLVKYPGMTGTEILLNESQERMAIAVNEKYVKEIEAIFKKHEVEFSDIGNFTDSGRSEIDYKGERIVDMDMDFINNGYPKRSLNPKDYKISRTESINLQHEYNIFYNENFRNQTLKEEINYTFDIMVRRPNLGSMAPIMDRKDSTVKGLSVQHCIQGRGRVSTKVSAKLVDINSPEAIVQSYGHCERQSYIDSKLMGRNAFMRSIGHNLSMGARLDYMVSSDQALWQSFGQGEYQQMLIEANSGMADVISGMKKPVITGKDSMENRATMYDVAGNKVEKGVFPTLLMSTFGKIDDAADVVTIDAKCVGDLVYVVGATTKPNLGGSEYNNMISEMAGKEFNIGQVSNEEISEVYDTFERVDKANKENIFKSNIYLEDAGLTNALNKKSMAGQLGIKFDIGKVHHTTGCTFNDIQYSETEGRFLVTIDPNDKGRFEELFEGKYSQIGKVTGENLVMEHEGKKILDRKVIDNTRVYHKVIQ